MCTNFKVPLSVSGLGHGQSGIVARLELPPQLDFLSQILGGDCAFDNFPILRRFAMEHPAYPLT